MLSAICCYLMADLKEHRFCVTFSFAVDKAASETYEMLNTAFGDSAIGRTQTAEYFSPNAGKLRLKIMGVQVVRPQITEAVRWRKFAESLTKTDQVPFEYHRRVRPLVWNVLANCKGRYEYGANHREVHGSVTYRRTDARTVFDSQEHGSVPIRSLSLFFILWFLLASENEIIAARTSFLGSPWNFRNNRWPSYTRFYIVCSSGASSSGNNAEPVA